MIQLVFGEDTYRCRHKAREIMNSFANHRLVEEEDIAQGNPERLLRDQRSLFGGENLTVFKNILDSQFSEITGELPDSLKSLDSSRNILFWQTGKVDNRLKIVKWLKKNAEVFNARPLKESAVRKWIKEFLGEHEIDPAAVKKLISLHGNNLWFLESELHKLRSYAERGPITLEAVEKLGSRTVEEDIFAFVDALSYRNKSRAGQLLSNLLADGQDPGYLFAMIVRQFRLLLLAKTSDGLRGQHPYVVKKIKQQAPRWKKGVLRTVYEDLLRIDLDTKVGGRDLETELWLLVAEI